MTDSIDRTKLTYFLSEYFSDEEIVMLCLVEFPAVYNDFGSGMRKSAKVADLVAYCYRHEQVAELLVVLQRERPIPFPRHFGAAPIVPVSPAARIPVSRNPRQLFISHAHEDAPLAQRLAADLRGRGWRVWIAPESIQPGEQWVEAINRGLEESGVLLLLLSPAAVASSWVRRETNVAIELEHDGQMAFYPLEVRPCELPPLWRSYQRTPFAGRYEAALEKLLARLDGRAAPSPAASLLPPEPKPVRLTNSEIKTEIRIHPITGKEMVRIPAGVFLYGVNKDIRTLDEYWIDKTPITNAEYYQYLIKVGDNFPRPVFWKEKTPPTNKMNHPVVGVNWHIAKYYMEWAAGELPTEEQWEKAARGTDGRIYPWGNSWGKNHCNIFESKFRDTVAVGRFSPQGNSPYGCVDMVGNVSEWTINRMLRGGSFDCERKYASSFSFYERDPHMNDPDIGFRMVVRVFPDA